jgi:hypothetical protein
MPPPMIMRAPTVRISFIASEPLIRPFIFILKDYTISGAVYLSVKILSEIITLVNGSL